MERLLTARRKAMLPEVQVKTAVLQPPPVATQCSEHPGVSLEYWCEEDRLGVCHECMIFGRHKGHSATKSRKRYEEGNDYQSRYYFMLKGWILEKTCSRTNQLFLRHS